MTDEKEALRQAMEAIFYERDAGETPPPNLRILEKSRFPHGALARGTRARASLIESY